MVSGSGKRMSDRMGEGFDILRNVVSWVGVLRVRPDRLHRVEIRRVGWQPLDLEGSGLVDLFDFGWFAGWYGGQTSQTPPECEPP